MAQCTCDNCDWTGDEGLLRNDITNTPDLNFRLEPKNPAVVLVGNPIDGLTIVGPFTSIGEACLWAEGNCDHANWTATSVQSTTQFEES